MVNSDKKAMKFKGSVKSKDHVQVKKHNYGVKVGKSDVIVRKVSATKRGKKQLVKADISTARKKAILDSSNDIRERNLINEFKTEFPIVQKETDNSAAPVSFKHQTDSIKAKKTDVAVCKVSTPRKGKAQLVKSKTPTARKKSVSLPSPNNTRYQAKGVEFKKPTVPRQKTVPIKEEKDWLVKEETTSFQKVDANSSVKQIENNKNTVLVTDKIYHQPNINRSVKEENKNDQRYNQHVKSYHPQNLHETKAMKFKGFVRSKVHIEVVKQPSDITSVKLEIPKRKAIEAKKMEAQPAVKSKMPAIQKEIIYVKTNDQSEVIKAQKTDITDRDIFVIKNKKVRLVKTKIESVKKVTPSSSGHVKFNNQTKEVKSKKPEITRRKNFTIKGKKVRLARQGMLGLGKLVITSSIRVAEKNEDSENSENANLTVGKVYRYQQNTGQYMKETNMNYQRLKQHINKHSQPKKQSERKATAKKVKERHATRVIDRKGQPPVKGVNQMAQMVKAKNTKVVKQQTSRQVKKVIVKKAGIKFTAGTIKGLKAKAVLLKIGSAIVGGAKAIASLVAMKFLVPIGVIGIVLFLLVAILVAIIGMSVSADPFIPISEEVLVTEIHVHLTGLDVDWNEANGIGIRTNTKDVIALIFMSGGVDPERESNEEILNDATELHQIFHESGAYDMVSFLMGHPVLFTLVDDFIAFREFAFFHFYGTLGDPYERDWRAYLTSRFGWRPDPFRSDGRQMHNGIDIAWEGIGGTPVLATISGRVLLAGYDEGGYGNWVMIVNYDEPGNRKETRYAHLRTMSVSVGQRIEVGDVVGLTGTTGSSTGDHLHHEFRRNGNLLNPYFYFPNHDLMEGDD